ncbi:MAG: hypothetical protein QXR51_06250 [Desulfurococcaceae archaeon]
MNYIRKITIVGLLIISLVLELTPIVQLSNAQQVVFRVGWGDVF